VPVTMLHLLDSTPAGLDRPLLNRRGTQTPQASQPNALGRTRLIRTRCLMVTTPLLRQQGTAALNVCLEVVAGQSGPNVGAGRGGHSDVRRVTRPVASAV
jgi:hypothetical protein